jgi:hypothetical protein
MNKFDIELQEYKYEFNNGRQKIYRNGAFLREETGDNLILLMALRIKELEAEVGECL